MIKYITNKFNPAGLALAFLFGTAFASSAATTTVQVGPAANFISFSPQTANINAGDTVNWVWQSSPHTSTSLAGDATSWDSGFQSAGFTFPVVFPNAGTFPYQCSIHGFEGMTGSVIVSAAAPNQPPSVTVTNPPTSSTLSAPANIKIGASAADSDGSVANVQFFLDGTSVATVTTAPYTATASNVAAGSHTITAIATDNLGATGTNSISLTVVTPVAVAISQPQMLSGTNFQFSYSANPGLSYLVARSINLTSATWLSLSTNKAQSASVTFVDTNVPPNASFYRVGRLPNP